jgi:peptide/nickel transport system permease protein
MAEAVAAAAPQGALRRFLDSDFFWSFSHSKTAVFSLGLLVLMIAAAFAAPLIAPQNPFDLASLDIADASLPPSWQEGGSAKYLLGTDDQGRDLLSAMLYGLRLSLVIGLTSVALSIVLGVVVGLFSGCAGGWIDAFLMRVCDVMLSFPAILVALLTDGILHAVMKTDGGPGLAYFVLIFSITLSGWVKYARTVRAQTLVEKDKEYVLAARIVGASRFTLMFRHILPNVLGPVLVLGTIHVAMAVMTEATLSFLGVGVPPTTPSLGTLIRIGNDYLFSGEWWMTIFPGAVLIALVVAVNLLGDWLRDALDSKLEA